MQHQFASRPGPGGRLKRWIRRYPAPLALTGVFVAVLVTASVLSNGGSPVSAVVATPAPLVDEEPSSSAPPVCGIGERYDSESRKCVLQTPAPCVKGSKFDEDEGYCVPEATPKPTPYPTKTLDPSTFDGSSPSPSATPARATPSSQPAQTPEFEDPATPRPPSTPAGAQEQEPAASPS